MGKDVDFFDMNNFTKYLNSDEASQTTKDVFFSTLLLGGAPAVISSNQMLGNGYNDSKATELGEVIGNAFDDESKYKINSDKLNEYKEALVEIYNIDPDNLKTVEDVARNWIAIKNQRNGVVGNEGNSIVEANNFITAVTDDTNRMDYSNETSRNIL